MQLKSIMLVFSKFFLSFLPAVILVFFWQWLSNIGFIDEQKVPSPRSIIEAWYDMAHTGRLSEHIGASLWRVFKGFSYAAVLSITLAAIISLNSYLLRAVKLIAEFLRPISPIAWIPLAILWFEKPAIFIVFIAAFYPIFFSAIFGFSSVPKDVLITAKAFKASRVNTLINVVIPSAIPTILNGLNIALAFAWMSLIAAELAATSQGLGYLVQISRVSIKPERVFALMMTIGILGLTMNYILSVISRWLVPWLQDKSDF